jgi:hypothetical protein
MHDLVKGEPAMSLHPKPIGPVPEETARIAHAVFPRGSTYLRLRDELGPIYDDEAFCALFPARGQPAEAPWRLALATTLQFAVVYWRSLRNALPVEEWLAGAIGALSGQQAVPSAGQMARLDLLLQRLVRRPTGPKPVGAVQKVLLINRFQHHGHRPLKNLVFEGRYPDRASGRAIALRDIRPLHGWRSVAARLGAVKQIPEILLQVVCVDRGRLSIYTWCAILPRAPIGLVEPGYVDMVV